MYSIEEINKASIKELISFAESNYSVYDVLTPEEAEDLRKARKIVYDVEASALTRAERIISRVRDEIHQSDYDGTFEEMYGYDEDDASDVISNFGGSISFDLDMDFDGEEFWESSSCY